MFFSRILLARDGLPRVSGVTFAKEKALDIVSFLLPGARPERKDRAAKYFRPVDAARCLLAGWLLEKELASLTGRESKEWEFTLSPHGKPVLAGVPPDIHFNLSHSGEWVLCATHDVPVGVDIERVGLAGHDTATAFMSPGELEAFERAGPSGRQDFFYRTWTLKESLLKATGLGLMTGLKRVDLSYATAPCSGEWVLHRFEGGSWRLVEISVAQGYRAAVSFPWRS